MVRGVSRKAIVISRTTKDRHLGGRQNHYVRSNVNQLSGIIENENDVANSSNRSVRPPQAHHKLLGKSKILKNRYRKNSKKSDNHDSLSLASVSSISDKSSNSNSESKGVKTEAKDDYSSSGSSILTSSDSSEPEEQRTSSLYRTSSSSISSSLTSSDYSTSSSSEDSDLVDSKDDDIDC